jgi:hypothetical protein
MLFLIRQFIEKEIFRNFIDSFSSHFKSNSSYFDYILCIVLFQFEIQDFDQSMICDKLLKIVNEMNHFFEWKMSDIN